MNWFTSLDLLPSTEGQKVDQKHLATQQVLVYKLEQVVYLDVTSSTIGEAEAPNCYLATI